MRNTIRTIVTSVLACGAALMMPQAKAGAWDQLTKVTFSAPVEIPGQVLPAGTYWFKLLDSESNRNIVQIYNADQNKQLAMIMAIPDYRLQPTGKTVITFAERASDTPEAVKAWFYPGDQWGQEFVYPKKRAQELAKVVNQPVPSMPSNLEANTKMTAKSPVAAPAVAMKQATVKAEQPTGGEVEIAQVIQTPPQLQAQNTPPATTPARTTPAETLPTTATRLPLIGLLSSILLCAGLLLRLSRSRVD